MTLLEQIAKISEEKELHITNLSIQIECMNNTIDSLKDENIKLRNAIVSKVNNMQRSFLDFKFNENSNPSNSITSNSFDIHVRVFTDISGNFAWLGIIPFREFAKRIGKHVEITESETTDNKKLYELSALWRDISPKIGGYLYGDIEDARLL